VALKTSDIIQKWFEAWETGNYEDIPITDDFKHTSPYGTIAGKDAYLALVAANEDKFLGHTFKIHDALYGETTACVRYTGERGDFSLDVSEWYKFEDNMIREIISYYNIEGEGEIEI